MIVTVPYVILMLFKDWRMWKHVRKQGPSNQAHAIYRALIAKKTGDKQEQDYGGVWFEV